MKHLSIDSFAKLLSLLLLAYLPLSWNFGVLFTGDQKTYIRIAQEMFAAGDWVHPLLFGETCYLKPPLQYWGTLLGFQFFGVSVFAAYFPLIGVLLLTTLVLWKMEAKLFQTRNGYAAAMFATCMGTFTYAQSAQMEIYLVWLWTQAWYFGWQHLRDRRWKSILLALGSAGALSLAKSPLYSVLWCLAYLAVILQQRSWWILKTRRLYVAILLGIATGLSWYIAVYITDQQRFWSQYVQIETFSKSGGNRGSLLQMWWDFSTFLWPFLLLVLAGLVATMRRQIKFKKGVCPLVLGMTLPGALFFSLFPYRTETYLYLLIPGTCLGLSQLVSASRESNGLKWGAIVTGALFPLMAFILGWLLYQMEMISLGVWGFYMLASLATGHFFARRHWQAAFALGFVWILALRLVILSFGAKEYDFLQKHPQRGTEAKWVVYDPSRAVWGEAGLFGLLLGSIPDRAETPAALARAIDGGARALLSEEDWQVLRTQRPDAIYRTRLWKRWKRRGAFPWQDLLLQGKASIPDWDVRFYRNFYEVEKAP